MKKYLVLTTLLLASTSLFADEEPNTLKVTTDTTAPTVGLDKSDITPASAATAEKTATSVSIDPENRAGTVSADQTAPSSSTKMLNTNQKDSSKEAKSEPAMIYSNKHPDEISGEYDYDPNYED